MRRTLLILPSCTLLLCAFFWVTHLPAQAPPQNPPSQPSPRPPAARSAAPANRATRNYSFTGRLLATSEAPLANAEVTVLDNKWQPLETAITGVDGRFAFTGFPEGVYILQAERSDFGTVNLGAHSGPTSDTAYFLNPKFPHQDLTFHIVAPAIVSGIIRAPEGEPLPNVQVRGMRRAWKNGRAAWQQSGFGQTDDEGRFAIGQLQPGRYRFCAISNGNVATSLPIGSADFTSPPSESRLIRYCYPDGGQTIVVKEGDRTQMDFNFLPVIPLRITGTLSNVPPEAGVSVDLVPLDRDSVKDGTGVGFDQNHNFTMEGVVPGRYMLTARTHASQTIRPQLEPGLVYQPSGEQESDLLVAKVAIDATGGNIEGLNLTLAPQPTVEVVLHAASGSGVNQANLNAVAVGLKPVGDPDSFPHQAARDAHGNLRIHLDPGDYWLVVRTPLCPVTAVLADADAGPDALQKPESWVDALFHQVTVPNAGHKLLDITLSDKCGTIAGQIVDADGKPVPKARNLMMITGTPQEPGDLELESVGDDAKFEYSGLTPGRYYLMAWLDDSEWNGEIGDLSDLASHLIAVDVGTGETKTIRLKVMSTQP